MALTIGFDRFLLESEFQTNLIFTDGDQRAPDVLGLANGGFVAAYTAAGGGVYLNFYNPDFGNVGGAGPLYASSTTVAPPSLAQLSDGNVLVVWDNDDKAFLGGAGIKGALFTPQGQPIGGNLNLLGSMAVADPQAAALAGGGFALAVRFGGDVFVHRYDNAGNALANGVLVNTGALSGVQSDAAVAALADGGFVVTYTDTKPAAPQIRGAIFNANGSVRTGDFLIGAFGSNTQSKAVGLPNGNWAVVYTDTGWAGADAGNSGITLQIFDPDGIDITPGGFVRVNTPSAVNESDPDVTVLPNGFILVTWTRPFPRNPAVDRDIYARLFDGDGTPVTVDGNAGQFAITTSSNNDVLSAVSRILGGQFVTSWQDSQSDGSGGRISSTIHEIRRTVSGDDANDRFIGDELRDLIQGGDGNDTLNGSGGDDTVLGANGSDSLFGGLGNDLLFGGAAGDTLNGGSGNDSLDGGGGADAIAGGLGNDTLIGAAGNDTLSSGSGDDTLIGGTGSDTLDGGPGSDTLTGGAEADRFVFAPGHDSGRITDFEENLDQIDLTAFGFATVAEAKSFASNVGTDVVFAFAGGEELIVENITKAQLTGADLLI